MMATKIKSKLKALLGQLDNFIDAHIHTALRLTRAMKDILGSPVADIITLLIPGNADDVLKDKLVNALSKAIDALTIAEQCQQHTDLNEKLKCFMQQLQLRDPHLQDALLLKLASLLTSHLDGRRLKQSLYDLYTQAQYSAAK